MRSMRVLCLGAGYFSQFHLDSWSRMPDVELVGICDLDRQKAEAQSKQFGAVAVYNDPEQAIRESRPDVVDIITRPDSHLALVELVARHNLPIICQKPLAPDFETSIQIVRTASAAGVPLMVHENFRFQPWHRELKRLLELGVIGDRLHSITCQSRMGDGHGTDAYLCRQPYFRDMKRLLIFETGIHFIDTFRFLAGEIQDVFAVLRKLNPVIQGEDAGHLIFRFSSGAVGVWDANRYNEGTVADPRLTLGEYLIEANQGSLRLNGNGQIFIQPLGEPPREHLFEWTRGTFSGDCVHQTQQHFLQQLRAGAAFETSGSEYMKSLLVQEAAYRSASQNRPVPIAEFAAELNVT